MECHQLSAFETIRNHAAFIWSVADLRERARVLQSR